MGVYRIDGSDHLTAYNRKSFDNQEFQLHDWLEQNPEVLLDGEPVFYIGREVKTDLGTFIDLLGLDREGNAVVVEVKRGTTPREVIAQALEYTAWVEELDYDQLDEIYQQYKKESDLTLAEAHRDCFESNGNPGEPISFNKHQHTFIVAETVDSGIRSVSRFLNKKGINVTCIEFSYFQDKEGAELLTTQAVVRPETTNPPPPPEQRRKIFFERCGDRSKRIYTQILNSTTEHYLLAWNRRGFALRKRYAGKMRSLINGYPNGGILVNLSATGGMPVYEELMEQWHSKLKSLTSFMRISEGYLIQVNETFSDEQVAQFIDSLKWISDEINKKENEGVR